MLSGTDWRLKDKLKIDIEPLFKNEARAIIEISAMLFIARPRVRGKEVSTAFLISAKLTEKEILGENPQLFDAITWIRKCIKAPSTTPKAKPYIPNIG